MSDFRVKYGLALGPYGSAGATSAQHIFTPGDTTPDVTVGNFFLTVNTSATTITYFDTVGGGGLPELADNGKVITILFRDSVTTIQNGGNIWLSGTQGALPAGSLLQLIKYNSAWYEMNRASNDQTPDQAGARLKTVAWSGTSAAINVTTADYVIATPSAASSTIQGFVGGVSGQTVRVKLNLVGTTMAFVQSAGNLMLAGTNAFYASDSGFYTFFTADGTNWVGQAGLVSP